MTRTQYRQARRLIRDNGRFALRWLPADQAAAMNALLAKTDDLIAERRRQRLDTLKPSGSPARPVTLDEAVDLDQALQSGIDDLQRDFTTLFGRYNTLINELSTLHATEANLSAKSAN